MHILQRIELNFWQIAIPLIRDSVIIRFLLSAVYRYTRKTFITKSVLPAVLIAALGLAIGYLGGLFFT